MSEIKYYAANCFTGFVKSGAFLKMITALLVVGLIASASPEVNAQKTANYIIPEGYLDEATNIPDFWLSTLPEIENFLKKEVRKGKVEIIGRSAGGRPLYTVFYGKKREGKGTTTFSGSLAVKSIAKYRGAESDRLVYMGLSGVHGFELEGIVGTINLIKIFETGYDLRGKPWPHLQALADSVDRIVLMPLVNPDGRERVPIRMEPDRGAEPNSYIVHEFLNTGGKKDGKIIGWPACKEHIPMNFGDFGFPGAYPNDAGVNIMHDDFLGFPQPETKALLSLTASEMPDLILNMHTGVPKRKYFMQLYREFIEPAYTPLYEQAYKKIKSALTRAGLQESDDVDTESDPSWVKMNGYNLSTALNLNCGALNILIESPSHGYQGTNSKGVATAHTPETLLDAQLIAHQEAIRFLVETGGRTGWEKSFAK